MHFCPTPVPPTWLDARVLASLQILYSIWTLANSHFVHVFLSSASPSNLWSLPNKFPPPKVHSQINQPSALLPVSAISSGHSAPSQPGTPWYNSSRLCLTSYLPYQIGSCIREKVRSPHAQQSTLYNKQSCKYMLNGFINPLLLLKPRLRSVLLFFSTLNGLSLQMAPLKYELFLCKYSSSYANIRLQRTA